jgi:hypothetical protein
MNMSKEGKQISPGAELGEDELDTVAGGGAEGVSGVVETWVEKALEVIDKAKEAVVDLFC